MSMVLCLSPHCSIISIKYFAYLSVHNQFVTWKYNYLKMEISCKLCHKILLITNRMWSIVQKNSPIQASTWLLEFCRFCLGSHIAKSSWEHDPCLIQKITSYYSFSDLLDSCNLSTPSSEMFTEPYILWLCWRWPVWWWVTYG